MIPQSSTRRETAKITSVEEIHSGEYVVREGWQANYVQTTKRQFSRVNIIGLVVSKDSVHQFNIDDGTGTILVTDFNQTNQSERVKIGEPVLIIGRPRQANGTIFIASEVIQATQLKEQPLWVQYRKEELAQIYKTLAEQPDIITVTEKKKEKKEQPVLEEKEEEPLMQEEFEDEIDDDVEVYSADEKKQVLDTINVKEPVTKETLSGDDIISFVKKKDTGDGCLVDEIVEYFGDVADDIVTTLISMGEIYEIKPGRVKVLE